MDERTFKNFGWVALRNLVIPIDIEGNTRLHIELRVYTATYSLTDETEL